MEYIVASFLWIAWCALHSAMISIPAMTFLQRHLGRVVRFHRLAYNLISLLTLIPVFLYSHSVHSPVLFRWAGSLAAVPYVLLAAGSFLFIAGARRYDALQFLGIRQIRENRTDLCLGSDECLSASGIHRLIRHPWYAGGIMVVWARDLTVLDLIVNVILTGYFIIGAYLEEKKLVLAFGDDYRQYQKSVSMFLPIRWLVSAMRGRRS
jgi:protein-S-isoprenylcysteine O-methyltransferase Ste14